MQLQTNHCTICTTQIYSQMCGKFSL